MCNVGDRIQQSAWTYLTFIAYNLYLGRTSTLLHISDEATNLRSRTAQAPAVSN